MMSRHGILGLVAVVSLLVRPSAGDDGPGPSTSLRAKFGGRFAVGVALGGKVPGDYSAAERSLIDDQFN